MANILDYPEQWRPLIRRAESAFDGKLDGGIVNGCRIRRSGGGRPQLCTLYWGQLRAQHCLELAVSKDRALGRVSSERVARWIEQEIGETGRRGAKHKGTDSWPTLGFDMEEQAQEFLGRVQHVREGQLNPDANERSSRESSAQVLLAAYRDAISGVPDSTVAHRKTKQRVGQALLRRALMEIWGGRCGVTGLTVRRLLRCSHIKPWAEASDEERLNPENCLLLAPHLDAAFDAGFISFNDDGAPLVSTELHPEDMACLGLAVPAMLRIAPSAEQQDFLGWHRLHRLRGAHQAALSARATTTGGARN